MRKNPFLRAERTVIKKVWYNKAELQINVKVKTFDALSGEFAEQVYIFSREIFLKSPSAISDFIVDGKSYLAGDMKTEVALFDVKGQFAPQVGDPTIIINSASKTIRDFRTPDNRTGGIDIANDKIIFGGTTYRIIDITPKNFYAGTPSRLKLHLRAQ